MFKRPVVSLRNINHFLGEGSLRSQILYDINFDMYPGEIVIMTGPSGSGKTTLLTLIGALRSVQSGCLTVFNRELHSARRWQLVRIRRHIGYIFQDHNLLDFLTAAENVQTSVQLHPGMTTKAARTRAIEMLEAVKLGHRINHYPRDLSGGQKQRVAIARALVSRPGLILADEITSSLDSRTGRDIVELLMKLSKERGCAILIVTHDNRILDVADQIIRMEDGHLFNNVSRAHALWEQEYV